MSKDKPRWKEKKEVTKQTPKQRLFTNEYKINQKVAIIRYEEAGLMVRSTVSSVKSTRITVS